MRKRRSASRIKYSIWARRSYGSQEKLQELLAASTRKLRDSTEQRRIEQTSASMQAMSIEMDPAAFEAQRSRLCKATPRLSIAT